MSLYTKNLIILLISICLFFSSFYLLLPTLPLYVQHIGGDQKDVGIIIGIFTLSSVLCRPFIGKFTDILGRKPLLISGAFIFLLSPFSYYVSSTECALILARIFHGVGIAAFGTSCIAMIADMSPPNKRGEAFGAFGLSTMIALSVSPAAGTWLLVRFSFSDVFLTEAILAGGALILSLLVKETFHIVPTRINGSMKGVVLPSLLILLCTITYGSIVAFLPFFARNISDFGLFYTAYAFSSILIRIPIGKISDRIGRQKIILPGLVTTCAALLILSQSNALHLLIGSGFLYGLGFSSVYPTLTALLVDRVHKKARARGLAFFTASFDLGIAVGSFAFGFIPLLWIYPSGSVIILIGILIFYSVERSSFSISR
jgi:MFS family permease